MHLTINLLSAKELEEDFKKLEAEKVKLLEDEKNLRKEVDAQILPFEYEVAAIRKDVENLKQISLLNYNLKQFVLPVILFISSYKFFVYPSFDHLTFRSFLVVVNVLILGYSTVYLIPKIQ